MKKEAYITKKEVNELTKLNEGFAKEVQNFFIKKFNFKKVDKTSLELVIGSNLLELRIYALADGVRMSLTFFNDHNEENISSVKDIEYFYKQVKTIIKRESK